MANIVRRCHWRRLVGIAAVALVVLLFFLPLLIIQLRLFRNAPIGQRLASELQCQYPNVQFRGAASYEREIIYIGVIGRMEAKDRQDVEKWLRARKRELTITPRIMIRYSDELDHQEIE